MNKLIIMAGLMCMAGIASAQVDVAVDLGLPSGVKWAACNIGASEPQEYGYYFAWGEIETKDWYDEAPYKWYTAGHTTKYKINNQGFSDYLTTLEPQDDVAHALWGGSWRMPTREELEELVNLCSWTWTQQKEVWGYRVTGPNGNWIFLPAAGYKTSSWLQYAGDYGCYWSSSLYKEGNDWDANYLSFNAQDKRRTNGKRFNGYTVRGVQ